MLFCEIKHVGEPATEAGSLRAGPGCGRLWGRRLPCQLDLLGRVHQAPQTQQVLLWSLPREEPPERESLPRGASGCEQLGALLTGQAKAHAARRPHPQAQRRGAL